MWNSMHNKHHATPQKINHDMDLDTAPFVAFFDTAFDTVSENLDKFKHPLILQISKFWMKFQMITFLPITSAGFSGFS